MLQGKELLVVYPLSILLRFLYLLILYISLKVITSINETLIYKSTIILEISRYR